MPLLSTVDQVAEFLHVRPLRIYMLDQDRQIPLSKIGPRQLRFAPSAVCQWLDARATPAVGVSVEER